MTAAREYPVIFSAPMVRAILAGTKTQTRRLPTSMWANAARHLMATEPLRLWVRETWQDFCPMWDGHWCGCGSQEMRARTHKPAYLADPRAQQLRGPAGKEAPPKRWRPSIHMPRWASRITLDVLSMRLERLQDISEQDARDECGRDCAWQIVANDGHVPVPDTWRPAFSVLWGSLHRKPGTTWADNPKVWRIEFRAHPKTGYDDG